MASIEEANLLFKNLVTYEKSVAMAKKYVKYHKAVIKDLKRLEKLEEAIDILKDELWLYENGDYRLSVMGSHDYQALSKMDYELLKEVLGNE